MYYFLGLVYISTKISLKLKETGEVIAEGVLGRDTVDTDHHYYMDSANIISKYLLVQSARTYTCPYKGLCYYQDLVDAEGKVIVVDATWIYHDPKAGWEHIKNKLGFEYLGSDDIEVLEEEVG